MNSTYRSRILAEEIITFFKKGITIDPHTIRYIDACFSGTSLDKLTNQICDEPDINIAPLMDLIFFPNEAFQIYLEPLLERESFGIEDEKHIIERLHTEKIQTTLREAEKERMTEIQVPVSILAPFVRRLKIYRRIPHRLLVEVMKSCPPKKATRLKVKLRNARFPFTPAITDFLAAFIEGIDTRADYFDDCFDLALALLDEKKDVETPRLLLEKRKEDLLRSKQAAVQFEKQLRSSNMETLMHQGVRAPEIGIADAEKKLVLLDRISRAAISKTLNRFELEADG